MPLDKQIVSVSFGQGVDLSTDEKQVIPGKLTLLENARLSASHKTISKRDGYVAIPTPVQGATSDVQAGRVLATLKDELFLGSGTRAYALSSLGYVDKGPCDALAITTKPIMRSSYQQTSPDAAFHSLGISVYAWEDSSGGVRYSAHDTVTGQPIVSNALLSATGSKPKAIVIGSYVVILYVDGGNLVRVGVPAGAPSSPTAVADVATNLDASEVYDAAPVGDRLVVSYINSDAANRVSIRYITETLGLSAEVGLTGTGVVEFLAVCGDDDGYAWIVRGDAGTPNSQVLLTVYDFDTWSVVVGGTLLATFAGTIQRMTALVPAGTATVTIFAEVAAAATYNTTIRRLVFTVGTPATSEIVARSVGLASKPWYVNGLVHVLVAHESTLQPTYFVLTATGDIVGKIAPGTGGGLASGGLLPEVMEASDDVFSVAFLQAHRLDPSGGNVLAQMGVMLAELDFDVDQAALELSDDLHVTGGCLWMFDGARTVEHGFHLYPENLSAVASGSGGTVTAGQHQYLAVYEWTDNAGLVHRSAPSVPVTVTTSGATASVAITIPTLRLTAKPGVSVVVYGTQAAGTVFYRLTSLSSPLVNSTTADTVAFTATASDSAIAGNEQLYTTGGEVENIAAPAPLLLAKYRNRAILVPAENPLSWWFSKKVVQGAPIEFSDSFVQAMDQGGGPITAAGVLDEKLILFKRSQVYVVAGDGPSANGQGSDLTEPARIPTDSGCISARSVVLTPAGLMYQSEKGIELLDRSLTVRFVGEEVDAYRDDLVTAAVVVADHHEVRFTLDSGLALVWNYVVQQWSVSPDVNAVDAVTFQNRYTYLRPSGLVLQETPDTFTDDGSLVRVKAKTAWMSFAGLQGFQRVYRLLLLGAYKGAHKIRISLAYDFNPEPSQVVEVDAEDLLGAPVYGADATFGSGSPYGGEFPLYEFRLHLANQKCTAVQVTLEEVQLPPYTEGMQFSALCFEVGAKKGARKMAAGRTVT